MEETIRDFSISLRKLILEMVHRAKASHVGSALSIADIISVLYREILRIPGDDPMAEKRDRFILSKGHACTAVYAALRLRGFLSDRDIQSYGQDGSSLMNHISHHVRGVEFSTGSLGHGLPFGVGKALAARCRGECWRVYVLLSDGEMDEGSNWEALMLAGHHKLSNLVAVVDYNKLQSLGTVESTLGLEPLADKLRAFNWEVVEVDGHDHRALAKVLDVDPTPGGKPRIVIAHTVKGSGVSFMENEVKWHYSPPTDLELQRALAELES